MNPRKDFSDAALATLRDSMTRYGQLQPSIVQPYKPNANTVLYRAWSRVSGATTRQRRSA